MSALAIGLVLAACGSNQPAPATVANAEAANTQAAAPAANGETTILSVSGAFALFPMMTLWADQYKASHPNVDFDIQAGGAGKGMTDVLAGAVDIAMVSRELRDEEKSQGAYGVPTTIDAVVGTFNANNPHAAAILAKGITAASVASIWISGTTTTWGQFLGTDASDSLNVYTRADAAGAAEQWVKFGGGAAQEELLGTGVNADPGLAEAVRQDPLGVGYNNIGFAYDPTTLKPIAGLQILPIDLNGDGQISPDENFYDTRDHLAAAIASGQYPSPPARVLYLVTKGEPSALIQDFYRWILSDAGQALVPGAGYVQLNAEQLAAAHTLVGE
jgi:phosphate transport system substrate-binding protein